VALKFLPPAFTKDSEAKQRFIHEAQAASSLDHPNIYTIHEIDETNDGRLFICMTRYAGKSLNDILDEHELSLNESVDIAIQIARGLSKAHKNGIVHQDIKPANVLITEDGIAKIVDFGIARMTDQNISQSGSMVGTAAYMSPEQASGEMVDERSDIWSLGVVLYEMLTGELPFQGQYEQAVIYSIINQDPEPAGQLRPEIPEKLERIVDQALQKNPLERYQQIEDMLNDLMNLNQGTVTGHLSGKLVGEEKQMQLTILPFFNLSGKKEHDYFCEGFAEDLQNILGTMDNIHISSFKESMELRKKHEDIRDISKHVSSEMILEGAIRRSETTVRITTQLINVEDGINIWADRYESAFEDILELRSEIIHDMMETLDITIDDPIIGEILSDSTNSVDAFDNYLKGLQSFRKFSRRSLQEAQDYFAPALKQDDQFLSVREVLALTHFQKYLIFEDVEPGIQFEKIAELCHEHSSTSPVCDALIQFISLF
jgi:serine/threonine protein kinase